MKSRPFALMLVLLIGLVGCGDDDDGGTAPPTKGTVVIGPQPEGIDAPWAITGPAEYDSRGRYLGLYTVEGSGAIELRNRAAGDYTIDWGDVDDYETPPDETLSLAAGGTITFVGVYSLDYSDYFVYIPPGTFMMGSPEDEPGRWEDEGPLHQVTLTQGFYMSKYQVTEEWWAGVMNETLTTSQLPKNYVSWDMAVLFCNALSAQEGLTPAYTIHGSDGDVIWNQNANGYRLPTEAEWEYACRAGSTTAFANGPIAHINCEPLDPNLALMGWYCGNTSDRQNVGQKQANAWGLYDMHGNLREWVWCGHRTYSSSPQVDPVHDVDPGAIRVVRGGCYFYHAQSCRSAARGHYSPLGQFGNYGFRPVRSAFESP